LYIKYRAKDKKLPSGILRQVVIEEGRVREICFPSSMQRNETKTAHETKATSHCNTAICDFNSES
jgi:hypothetical protein